MNALPILQHYIDARRRFYEKLLGTKEDLDKLLEKMRAQQPSLQDVALLAGLQAEKRDLIVAFLETEDRFVEQLLKERSSETQGHF